ncbi:hypothetical protein PSTT_16308 [Puccinia striiformis]|uniref:Uncharacterized protein n=2 Tax=Puccinia striiformis TaxID=27350 RepID=A0A0L0VUU5_9BASI|nr:hypothetical protein PSTG_03626 [Puccinia striiformis f. sp. tritici PST-78]POV95386.1 hypothetical protein PSTT_16308 [Puccinia striiformis]
MCSSSLVSSIKNSRLLKIPNRRRSHGTACLAEERLRESSVFPAIRFSIRLQQRRKTLSFSQSILSPNLSTAINFNGSNRLDLTLHTGCKRVRRFHSIYPPQPTNATPTWLSSSYTTALVYPARLFSSSQVKEKSSKHS